jgi:VWFA-related protein
MGRSNVSYRNCLAVVLAMAAGLPVAAQDAVRATFRSSLDLVSVAVVARDATGRLLTGLSAADFEVAEGGIVRPIVQFQPGDEADARFALLVDSSGSMRIGAKPTLARRAADLLVGNLRPADAASVFSFDSAVRRLTPYTGSAEAIRTAVSRVIPYGTTCLFDAIAGTAATVMEDVPRARALVLLTDGIDTGSLHTPEDAARAAARLDIPVYVISVGGLAGARGGRLAEGESGLAALARRTGGFSADAAAPASLAAAARTIADELHHQYLLAFTAGNEPGWHGIEVRVRRGRAAARSRDGYYVR